MLAGIDNLEEHVKTYLSCERSLATAQALLDTLQIQRAYLDETLVALNEGDQDHPVMSLPAR